MFITPYEEFIKQVEKLAWLQGHPILRLQYKEWHKIRQSTLSDVHSIELIAVTESRNKNLCGLYAVTLSFKDVKEFWTSYYIHWMNENEKAEVEQYLER